MPHKNLKYNEPTGDEVKATTCYMCACRCGRDGALAICLEWQIARWRATGHGGPGRRHAPGMAR